MAIIAVGVDLVDIPRIAQSVSRYGHRFLRRVFTEHEIDYCTRRRDPTPHLAGRFAAKEAAMKALGTGHSQGVLWRDVEVYRRHGPPELRFHHAAADRFRRLGAKTALLSITHAETIALAQVVLLDE